MDALVIAAPDERTARTRDPRRQELAEFLRAKRKGLLPQQAGVVAHPRRRAPGLLREEVADRAGMSLSWYTWMEQARPTNPSARMLDGLAAALQLDAAERRHLFRLARPDLDPIEQQQGHAALSPEHRQWLQALTLHPAYALDATWDVIAWNEPAERIFGGFAHLKGDARNVIHRLLLDPHWRELFVDWETIIERAIAQFRAMSALHLGDARLQALIQRLLERSPHFARLWPQREVALPPACIKTLRQPDGSTLVLNYVMLRPADGNGDVLFTVYTPADAASAQRLNVFANRQRQDSR